MMVAGTCIGSGMIALPLVLVKLGLIPSLVLMLFTWILMYYTSLVSLELNLQVGRGLSLGALGRYFSGRVAELIGMISLKALSYALLAAYIYGGSSVLQKLLGSSVSMLGIETGYALVAMVLLLAPIKLVDHINRILFIGLLTVVAVLVIGLISMITYSNLPLVTASYRDFSLWRLAIPIVFASFGFQVIFHTLTNYCKKDARVLKRAFFWGTLIPMVVYIVWTFSVLIVVHHESPMFYEQMIQGKVEVGDLIKELSSIAEWQAVQMLVWWISLLAIATSVLGIGVGLCDSLNAMLAHRVSNPFLLRLICSGITVLPAYIVAVLIPNAFIAVLGFAGMILVVIAILLPIYLLWRAKAIRCHYPALGKKFLLRLSVAAGIFVMGCEVVNMVTR